MGAPAENIGEPVQLMDNVYQISGSGITCKTITGKDAAGYVVVDEDRHKLLLCDGQTFEAETDPFYARRKKLAYQLGRLGYKLSDIELAITTHGHDDHVPDNIGDVRTLVPRRDFLAVKNRDRLRTASFLYDREAELRTERLLDNLHPMEEGFEMPFGSSFIKTHQIGGHSPGSTLIEVQTPAGTLGILGDLLWQGCCEYVESDLDEWDRGFDYILENCQLDAMTFGHDINVADKEPMKKIALAKAMFRRTMEPRFNGQYFNAFENPDTYVVPDDGWEKIYHLPHMVDGKAQEPFEYHWQQAA
jgi:glyoxylase-like metal-dependent hydrolase (beta-lactamase superfamily II)